jgi:pimeloyl-ACP methyl ester carboxylesterase
MKATLKLFITLPLILLALYLSICLILYFYQSRMVYFPVKTAPRDPARVQILNLPDASLHLSVHEVAGPDAVLYFGGNAEDVSEALPGLAQALPQHAVYALHYRGYGGSSGYPSEAALHADALALFDKVVASHPHVSVIGRSLGTGVAVRLAANRPLAQLVLVTPYDSVLSLAKAQYGFLPADLLLKERFESDKLAPKLTVPTLMLFAEQDELIPRQHSEALLHLFPSGVARMQVLPGSGHNSIITHPGYLPALQQVLLASRH